MASVKFVAVSRSLKGIIDYVKDREKTDERLITGVNCVAESALDEFESVKKEFHKTDGRAYYHIVQAFSPDDPLDFDTAHEIGCKFAGNFQGYQALVVTHRKPQFDSAYNKSRQLRPRELPTYYALRCCFTSMTLLLWRPSTGNTSYQAPRTAQIRL